MLRMILEPRISSVWEAEEHVYSIPAAGTMPSRHWVSMTNERRVSLRSRAIEIWQNYFENDQTITPHPPIIVPEYRQMLSQPDGELIVEEA